MVNMQEDKAVVSHEPKRESLTPRQREIYDFLADKINNRGYGPTVREIGEQFEIKSPNGVMCHLKALERKGLIKRESNMSRAICLTDGHHPSASLKLLGHASRGEPLLPFASTDSSVDFGEMLVSEDSACVQIDGHHYASLGINDGDFVVVRQHQKSSPGSLIVALDERGNLVLARIDDIQGRLVSVLPEGHLSVPFKVIGTIVGVVRQLESIPMAGTAARTA